VMFAGSDLVFRSLEDKVNFIVRIGKDGGGRRRVMDTPILDLNGVSPNGEWAIASAGGAGESTAGNFAVWMESGASKRLCTACQAFYGPDGKWVYATINSFGGIRLALPLGASQEPPDSVATALAEAAKGTTPPGTHVIGQSLSTPGPDPSTYAWTKRDMQRNLFRIPLH